MGYCPQSSTVFPKLQPEKTGTYASAREQRTGKAGEELLPSTERYKVTSRWAKVGRWMGHSLVSIRVVSAKQD